MSGGPEVPFAWRAQHLGGEAPKFNDRSVFVDLTCEVAYALEGIHRDVRPAAGRQRNVTSEIQRIRRSDMFQTLAVTGSAASRSEEPQGFGCSCRPSDGSSRS